MTASESIVYVPHQIYKRDPSTGQFCAAYDLTPSEAFGRIIYLFHGRDNLRSAEEHERAAEAIRQQLQGATAHDWLLMTGAPALVAIAAVYFADQVGCLRLLRWNVKESLYEPIVINRT